MTLLEEVSGSSASAVVSLSSNRQFYFTSTYCISYLISIAAICATVKYILNLYLDFFFTDRSGIQKNNKKQTPGQKKDCKRKRDNKYENKKKEQIII